MRKPPTANFKQDWTPMLLDKLKSLKQTKVKTDTQRYLELVAKASDKDNAEKIAEQLDSLGVDYETFVADVETRDEIRHHAKVADSHKIVRGKYTIANEAVSHAEKEMVRLREQAQKAYQKAYEDRSAIAGEIDHVRKSQATLDELTKANPDLAAVVLK